VIGPDGGTDAFTAGGGSSHVRAPYAITPYDGITKRAGKGINGTYTPGISSRVYGKPNVSVGYRKAAQAAKKAEVAIVFANDKESEGHDRSSLQLPGHQDRLIDTVAKANPNTIVVLNTGGPVTMPWINEVKGVIEAWYPGQEDGNAIAAVLFGDTDPSGKLPITFAKRANDYPAHTKRQYPGVNGIARYSEGIFVGYRYFDEHGIEPLFPFGYGLSYTTFKLSDLTVAPKRFHPAHGQVKIHVNVTNTGQRAGAEVVQLYVGLPKAAGEPPKQLKGFEKVDLKPGETKPVGFTLSPQDLSYWNTRTHGWTVPQGNYRIMVGTSSRDIALSKVKTLSHE
jgi:beta-glucosidase